MGITSLLRQGSLLFALSAMVAGCGNTTSTSTTSTGAEHPVPVFLATDHGRGRTASVSVTANTIAQHNF